MWREEREGGGQPAAATDVGGGESLRGVRLAAATDVGEGEREGGSARCFDGCGGRLIYACAHNLKTETARTEAQSCPHHSPVRAPSASPALASQHCSTVRAPSASQHRSPVRAPSASQHRSTTSKAGTGAQDAVAGVGPEQSDLADTDSGLDAPLVTKRVSGDQKGKARIGEAGSAKGRQGTGRGRESESPESGSDLDKANKGGSGDQIGKRKDSTGEAGPAKRRQGPGRGRGRGGVGSSDVSGDGQGPGLKRGCEENVQLSSRTEAKKKAAGRGGAAKCDGESVDAGKGAARQGPVGQGRRQVRSDADSTELRGPPRVGSRRGRG